MLFYTVCVCVCVCVCVLTDSRISINANHFGTLPTSTFKYTNKKLFMQVHIRRRMKAAGMKMSL